MSLTNGLRPVLDRDYGRWTLRLGRQGQCPSDLECALWLDAFRLPTDLRQTRLTPTSDGWCVVTFAFDNGTPVVADRLRGIADRMTIDLAFVATPSGKVGVRA